VLVEATERELLRKKVGRWELGCLRAGGGCGRGEARAQMMDRLGCVDVRRIVRAPVEVLYRKMRGLVVAQNVGTQQISRPILPRTR
jgi:hypothetical protein